jgi:hypothetical protein
MSGKGRAFGGVTFSPAEREVVVHLHLGPLKRPSAISRQQVAPPSTRAGGVFVFEEQGLVC